MPLTVEELVAHHTPTQEQLARIGIVREAFAMCLGHIKKNVKDNRYRSVAITELESSAMFAIKGLVLEDQVPCRQLPATGKGTNG